MAVSSLLTLPEASPRPVALSDSRAAALHGKKTTSLGSRQKNIDRIEQARIWD